jgi:AhpD family alkylhydroperoxidase
MSDGQVGVFTAWPEGLNAMRAVDASCDTGGLHPRLLELVRLWSSIINGCAFCIRMHRRKASACGVSIDVIKALVEGRDWSGLDEGERAALTYTKALTELTAIEEAKLALAAHFDAREIVILSFCIAQINAWNRLAMSQDV